MSKVIGVGDEAALLELKRWLLLVDEIAVPHDEKTDWECRTKNPSLAADLDWLRERGIVSTVSSHVATTVNVEEVKLDGERVLLYLAPASTETPIRSGPPDQTDVDPGIPERKPMTAGELVDALQDIVCRLECESLRRSREVEAVSLRRPSPRVVILGERVALGDIHNIAIKAMPQPSETTSLESILDFRRDPETKRKLLAFRRWMAGMAKLTSPRRELMDELEWLLGEYETHMRVHKMKIRKGVFETVITGAAEIAEDFVKIKWGKLAKVPFAISARKIELLEAELNAPGREIAYIAHARSEFEKS
jgi:hypothetical protein